MNVNALARQASSNQIRLGNRGVQRAKTGRAGRLGGIMIDDSTGDGETDATSAPGISVNGIVTT